jgi:WD40 repeat protein
VVDQLPPRRHLYLLRWSLILWSLLAVFLVGLGLMLNAWLSPQPRCVIPIPGEVRIDFLSDDGSTILTILNSRRELGIWNGPFQKWDTHTGQNLGTYLKDVEEIKAITTSPDSRFMAVWQPDGKLHLVDLTEGRETKSILHFSWQCSTVFSSKSTFLAAWQDTSKTGHLIDEKT